MPNLCHVKRSRGVTGTGGENQRLAAVHGSAGQGESRERPWQGGSQQRRRQPEPYRHGAEQPTKQPSRRTLTDNNEPQMQVDEDQGDRDQGAGADS